MPLFKITNGYPIVYNWFNYLKMEGHYIIICYVIMPHHLHAIIAFSNTGKSINTIVGNGKRFMAYELVNKLKESNRHLMLADMQKRVNTTDSNRNKLHEVFEPSFDWKECRTVSFLIQKLNYIHWNPCKAGLCKLPEEYEHSSAKFYVTGEHGVYKVTSYIELEDVDLTKKL